tara:strand:+ start:11551 stop:12279 length:729 start_codon:yes stop_codon:yes gene_type:complete
MKMWYGIGACVSVGVAATTLDKAIPAYQLLSPVSPAFAASGNEAGESGEGAVSQHGDEGGEAGHWHSLNDYPGELSEALEKIWAGEGGEGGAGLGRMWPSVRIPALTNKQLEMVVPGNTLRNNGRSAVYYDESGKLEGWVASYKEVRSEKVAEICSAQAIVSYKYWREGERCWEIVSNPMKGSWKIENHKLCTNVTVKGQGESKCWHVALILDRVGLFDEDGVMHKVGRIIKRGRVLDLMGD